MKTQLVLALFAALALSACGKMKPLTAEQKAILVQTQEGAGRGQSAPPRSTGRLSAISSSQDDEKLAKLRDSLSDTSLCESYSPSESSFTSRSENVKFGVRNASGKICPLIADFSMTVEKNSFTMNASFKVQDEELKTLNDIYEVTMEMKGSGDEDEGEIEGKGTFKSVRHGEVKFEIEAEFERSGKSVDGELVMRYEFEDFEAELKAEVEDGKNTFYINDEEVTEKEFMDFMNKGGPGFERAKDSPKLD